MIVVRYVWVDEDDNEIDVVKIESFPTIAAAQHWIKTVSKRRPGEARILIKDASPGVRVPAAAKLPTKNPAPTPGKKALKMYETFNGYQPKKIGVFPASFTIPSSAALAGDAVEVLYRSSKLDPVTGAKPKRPVDYIHDHDAGVKVYRTDLDDEGTRVPLFITDTRELVLLGECLGLAYRVGDDETEMQVAKPYPELYTIPSGKALVVVQDKRRVVALIWGGRLGVEARGIVH